MTDAPRLIIAVSVDGEYPSAQISIGTAHQLYSMPFTMVRVFSEDVVRARNRLAQTVLDTTDATHVLWWDTDTFVPDVQGTLDAMLASGHDVIGAAYARKRKPRASVGVPLVTGSNETLPDGAKIREMSAIGFGFTLTSKAALTYVGQFADDYIDVLASGDRVRTANRFGLAYRHLGTYPGDNELGLCECDNGPCHHVELVSEDYSFCLRWRKLGKRIFMIEPSTPLQHMGMHAYE
jgi:hypothetical protein